MAYDLYDFKLGKLKPSVIGRNILQIQSNGNTNYTVSQAWSTPVPVNLSILNFQQGSKLKHENGKITVLEDMVVRVSGNLMLSKSTGQVVGSITYNGSPISEGYVNPSTTSKWEVLALSPKIVNAKANDVFGLGVGCGTANQTIATAGGKTTYLLVEEV